MTKQQLNIKAEINENTSCSCGYLTQWEGKCGELCPCMNIDCDDDNCGGSRGCIAGNCTCLDGGECD